jgi:signal transduction histidine kinase
MNSNAIILPFETPTIFPKSPPLPPLAPPKKAPNRPGGFVAALAHEVRNPLTNINLALEMANSTSLTGEQRLYTDIIKRGIARINDLINSLLLYEQTEQPNFDFHSVNGLLDEVLAISNDRAMLKRIRIRKEYVGTEPRVLVDKEKMKMAISNIIINAIDAMTAEKGELRLVTRLAGDRVTIEVHDNGTGISKENLQKIFQPFFTNKPGGMGLGLSATWEIIRENHATVDVQSQEGVGTCFTLSFNKA